MSMSRFSSVLSSSILAFRKSGGRTRAMVVGVALCLGMVVSVMAPAMGNTAYASNSGAPSRQVASAQFLTLPFEPTARMSILSGWYYSSSGGFHGGIDFINGDVNSFGGWQTFPVIASADGEACGNCTSRQGNAVWIKHNIDGATYYTYYGHLASISKDIPLGSQSRLVSVKRGQVIGMAGSTGASGALHLHFGLYNANSTPIDPYSIGKLRQYYPAPRSGQPGIGWFMTDAEVAAR